MSTEPGATASGNDPSSSPGHQDVRRVGAVLDGLRLAIGTLTAIPIRPPITVDRASARWGMALAPVAAMVPAVAAAGVAAGAMYAGASTWVSAALALAASILSTRGLHLDGLADTADGLAAAYERDRALAVMRTGNTGPAGATALVLVLLLQFAAWAQLLGLSARPIARGWTFYPPSQAEYSPLVAGNSVRNGGYATQPWLTMASDGWTSFSTLHLHVGLLGVFGIAASVILGRLALPLLCSRPVPSARTEGLGAAVAGSVPIALAVVVATVTVFGVTAVLFVGGGVWVAGPVAGLVVLLAIGALGLRTVRRLGGITGDVLGAGVEIATAAAAVVLAAFL